MAKARTNFTEKSTEATSQQRVSGSVRGNEPSMSEQRSHERTATDDRIAENLVPAPIAPATRDAAQTEPDGLPPGLADDTRSPLDSVFRDPDVRTT